MKLLIISLFVLISCSSKQKTGNSADYKGLGADSVSADLISRYAPAPLDPPMARKIQAVLDIRSPGLGKVTNDGKKMLFGWGVTGTPQVWRLDGPRSFPVAMTGGKDPTGLVGMSNDGKTLFVSRDRDGEENPGLYAQASEGGELAVIQHLAKVQTSLSYVSKDGKSIFIRANDLQPDSYAIYRYDLNSKKKETLVDQPGLWFVADVEEPHRLLLGKSTGSLWAEYYELNLQTKSLKPVLGIGEKEEYTVTFSPKRNAYFVLTNKFEDFRRLYLYDGKSWTAVSEKKNYDVDSFLLDEQKEKLVIQYNDNGYIRFEVKDAKSLKNLSLSGLPKNADHLYVGSFSHNGRYMTIGVETFNQPRTSFVYDWETAKLTQWVIPSSPEIDTRRFAQVKLEYYPSRDGEKIPMFVRRPESCPKTCPVVVSFHGGPEVQSQPGFSTIAQLYVDAGFIFVEPNVRGSEGYGRKWLSADDGAKRLAIITDIEDAALYIKKAWAVDGVPPKIGVTGGSYGGYSTLYAMTRFAGAFDAGVAIVGMSNLITFLNNTAPYRRLLRITEYGDPEKDKAALIQLSPITYLQNVKSPLLIIQGVNDPRVPAGEAIQMQKTLEKKGIPSQLILFADEGHGSVKRENQALQYGHTLNFFEKHLR